MRLPTLNAILDRGGSLILVSHLGRPTGDPAADAPFRLDTVAARLARADRPAGREGRRHGRSRGAGRLRQPASPAGSWSSKTSGSTRARRRAIPPFARQMAALADCYVNDAFGTCHRDEASMVAVPEQFPPDCRAIGFLVEKELRILETLARRSPAPLYRRDGRRQGLRQDHA